MNIVGWLLGRKTQGMHVEFELPLVYAIETMTHMQNVHRGSEEQLTRDHIINLAVAEYMQRNLWTTAVDDVQLVPQVIRHDVSHESTPLQLTDRLGRNSF